MKIFKERTEWFEIPDDPDKSKLLIKYLNEGQQQEVVAKGRKLSFNLSDGVETSRMIPDEVKLREEGCDARIIDWENVKGEKGNNLPCTRKTKILISKENGFMGILAEMVKSLDEMVKKEREQEEKNLPDSQDGSQE